MAEFEPHITQEKRKEVEEIKKLISENKVLGVLNLENLPALNYMKIRRQLKDRLILKYSKKRLMKIAFDETNDENLKKIKDKLVGIPALLFANEDPFVLFQALKKSKTPAPAKAGDIAPRDIIIPAGPTDFTPGPMIGELGAIGIKTQVEGGKISIKDDKLLVKEGEVINEKQAELISKMGIMPMEIGLNLVLTYGDKEILERKVLDIDITEYENNIKIASGESFSLAMSIAYATPETIIPLISKAWIEAKTVRDDANILTSDNIGVKLAEADRSAKILEQPFKNKGKPLETHETLPLSTNETSAENALEEVKTEAAPVQEEVKEPEKVETVQENKIEEPPIVKEEAAPIQEETVNRQEEVSKEEKITEENKTNQELSDKVEPTQEEAKKPEVKNQHDVTNDDIQKAQDKIRELTDKKIKGKL